MKWCGFREKIKKKKRRNEKGRKKEKRVKEWKMLTVIPKFMFYQCNFEIKSDEWVYLDIPIWVYPEDWKIANVTPIFKKGSKLSAGNYRPVSLTSQVGKIMEFCLKDITIEHINIDY